MNIAQVVLNLDIGGLEKMVIDLAQAEKRAGHSVAIYSITHPGALAPRAEELGIPVMAFHKEHGFSLGLIGRMAREFRKAHIGAVHSHNAVIHHYAAIAGRLAGAGAVINTQHGLAGARQPRLMKLFSAVAPLTDAVVFVAAETEQTFRKQASAMPRLSAVIPNGIDQEPFLGASASPGTARPRFRIGTIGRMAPVKDHANLLRAFQSLLSRCPAAELHIMGYGELRQQTIDLAGSLGVAHRFFLHPPDAPVSEFLAALDVFVISSQSEALPVSLLEAMTAGLPVVSTRVGGIPDVAPEGDVAWFCPPCDPLLLSEALLKAAAAEDLMERGARAQQIAQRDFSAATMADRYISLINEIQRRKKQ